MSHGRTARVKGCVLKQFQFKMFNEHIAKTLVTATSIGWQSVKKITFAIGLRYVSKDKYIEGLLKRAIKIFINYSEIIYIYFHVTSIIRNHIKRFLNYVVYPIL